jgi:hypothetical protein
MPTLSEAQKILKEIRQGKTIIHDDYWQGECVKLGYDKDQQQFYGQFIDTIVGSYNNTFYYTEEEFLPLICRYAKDDV